MKIRTSFIANSSSSSYVITNLNHPAVYMFEKLSLHDPEFQDRFEVDIENKTIEDNDDNAIGWCCSRFEIDIDEFAYLKHKY